VSDVKSSGSHSDGRLNRFSNVLLRDAIIEFREPIGFPVPSVVPVPRLVAESLRETAASKTVKPLTAEDEARVVEVLERVRSSAGAMQDTGDAGVASEVIHEQVCCFSPSGAEVCVSGADALNRKLKRKKRRKKRQSRKSKKLVSFRAKTKTRSRSIVLLSLKIR
jgi:hypothetical protein